MKSYYRLSAILGFVIYGCSNPQPHKSKTQAYILNTSEMKEYPVKLPDTTLADISLIGVYSSETNSLKNVPGANVFLCKISKRTDTALVHSDTVVVLDTTRYKSPIKNIRLTDYWVEIEERSKLKKCIVNLPSDIFKDLKAYEYKYGKVTMVTDD
jgi:hypothetical protein